jgi:ABC-type iron transport system FetAB permease component
MMMHLSWSPIALLVMLVLVTVACGVVMTKFKQHRKSTFWCWLTAVGVVLVTAFDIGVRQNDLHRSSFNATIPNVIEPKIESNRPTVVDAKKSFEKTVKEMD